MTTTRSILVVDDDELLCRIMARALEEDGYRVFTAGNGEEALIPARQLGAKLSLVVTDLRMPVMDGIELASHLGRLDSAPPVLFVSGYGFAETVPGPMLAKPFGLDGFVAEVRRMIGSPELAGRSGSTD